MRRAAHSAIPRRDPEGREPAKPCRLGRAEEARDLAEQERCAERQAEREHDRRERLVAPAMTRRRQEQRVERGVETWPTARASRKRAALLAARDAQCAIRRDRDEDPGDEAARVERVRAEAEVPRVEEVDRAIGVPQAARHFEPTPTAAGERARQRMARLREVRADVDEERRRAKARRASPRASRRACGGNARR